MSSFFSTTAQGIVLCVRVTTKASEDKIKGVFVDSAGRRYLSVTVRALPDKGAANRAVIASLAKVLHIAKSKITLMNGATMRVKTFLLSEVEDSVRDQLEELSLQ